MRSQKVECPSCFNPVLFDGVEFARHSQCTLSGATLDWQRGDGPFPEKFGKLIRWLNSVSSSSQRGAGTFIATIHGSWFCFDQFGLLYIGKLFELRRGAA